MFGDVSLLTSNRRAVAGLVAALIVIGIGAHAQIAPPDLEIKVTAKKYDFKPDTITAKKGDRIRLVITAVDRDHGIKIDAFHINQKLPKGQAVTVEFTADQAGTFPFECAQFCGLGHRNMKGKLEIQ